MTDQTQNTFAEILESPAVYLAAVEDQDPRVRQLLTAVLEPMLTDELTYTYDTLEYLETLIIEHTEEGIDPNTQTVIALGTLLGETIGRNYDSARWGYADDSTLYDCAVVYDSKDGATQTVYPFRRVAKFFQDHTDGLTAMYKLAGLMIQMTTGELEAFPEDEWIELPGEVMVRYRSVTKEEMDEDTRQAYDNIEENR